MSGMWIRSDVVKSGFSPFDLEVESDVRSLKLESMGIEVISCHEGSVALEIARVHKKPYEP